MGEKFIVAETGFSIYTGRVFKAIQGNNLKDFVFWIVKSGGQVWFLDRATHILL